MKIGFIGLGIMGRPMAKNLIKAGYELIVMDLNKEAVNELKGLGAKTGTTSADVASKSDIIITMLPNSPQVKAVVLGAPSPKPTHCCLLIILTFISP